MADRGGVGSALSLSAQETARERDEISERASTMPCHTSATNRTTHPMMVKEGGTSPKKQKTKKGPSGISINSTSATSAPASRNASVPIKNQKERSVSRWTQNRAKGATTRAAPREPRAGAADMGAFGSEIEPAREPVMKVAREAPVARAIRLPCR
eukprot:scaffold19374_cov73-Isochrysis_galbana.AAC.1